MDSWKYCKSQTSVRYLISCQDNPFNVVQVIICMQCNKQSHLKRCIAISQDENKSSITATNSIQFRSNNNNSNKSNLSSKREQTHIVGATLGSLDPVGLYVGLVVIVGDAEGPGVGFFVGRFVGGGEGAWVRASHLVPK